MRSSVTVSIAHRAHSQHFVNHRVPVQVATTTLPPLTATLAVEPMSPSGSNGSTHQGGDSPPLLQGAANSDLPPLELATLGKLLDFWVGLGARLGAHLAGGLALPPDSPLCVPLYYLLVCPWREPSVSP